MKGLFKLIIGLILLVGVIALVFPGMIFESWGIAAISFLKGGIVWLLALISLILIILGISELKE